MNNIANIFSGLQNALANPATFFSSMGFPANAIQNPQAMTQQLVNSGRMSQQQLNQYYQIAQQIQSMPQFKQMLTQKFR